MSDNSSCYFGRHTSRIIQHHGDKDHPDYGKKVLILELSMDEWDVLSNGEFFSRLIKAKLLGASLVQIEGGETHSYLRFLTYILPLIKHTIPVRLCVDACKTTFVDKISQHVDGVCLDIRLPLKKEYTKEDRDACKTSGEYRSPMQFRDDVVATAKLVDHKPFTMFRIHKNFMSEGDIKQTEEYLRDFRSPITVVGAVKRGRHYGRNRQSA